MAEYTVLRLITADRSESIDLIDPDGGFALVSWSPAVARRRDDALGGRGLYEDVDEEIEIDIYGDTAAEVLARLQRLSVMLDRAAAFAKSGIGQPVWIECELQGSVVGAPLAALIVDSDRPSLQLSPTFRDDVDAMHEIASVGVTVRRRGEWLLNEYPYPNLIDNAGFWTGQPVTLDSEEPASIPAGWSLYGDSTDVSYGLVEGRAEIDGKAFHMVRTGGSSVQGIATTLTGLEAGAEHTISVYVELIFGRAYLQAVTGTAAVVYTDTSTRLSVQATPDTGGDIAIRLYTRGPTSAYLSNIMVEKVAPAYGSGPVPTGGPTAWHPSDRDMLIRESSSASPVLGKWSVEYPLSLDIPSPIAVYLGDNGPTPTDGAINFFGGHLLVAEQGESLVKVEAEDMLVVTGTVSEITDASASSGSAMRFGASTSGVISGTFEASDLGYGGGVLGYGGGVTSQHTYFSGGQIAVYAAIRPNGPNTVWRVGAVAHRTSSPNMNVSRTTPLYIDSWGDDYKPFLLGVVSVRDEKFTIRIEAIRQSGAETLDIDGIFVMAIDNQTARAVELQPAFGEDEIVQTKAWRFGVTAQPLISLSPRAHLLLADESEELARLGYYRDAYLLGRGNQIHVGWLETPVFWYGEPPSAPTPASTNLKLIARRWPAYLTLR